MDNNQEKQSEAENTLLLLDSNMKADGFFWRSKSKEQGFNLAVVDGDLSEKERMIISDLAVTLDRFNVSLIEVSRMSLPPVRLNRLDVGIDKDGEVFLIEQNPEWVDLLGFSDWLSGNREFLFFLASELRENFGVEKMCLLYSDYTRSARYEMEATAGIVSSMGMSSEAKFLGNLTENEKNCAYYLNSPLGALTSEERAVLERLQKENVVFPAIEMSLLEDKSLLLGLASFRPEAASAPDTFNDFIRMVRSGLSVLKPTRSFSTKGVMTRLDDLYEGGLLQVYGEVIKSGRNYILEREIDLRTVSGIGFDYVGSESKRAELVINNEGKKVMKPFKIKIDDWPVKYCVWTINGMVGPIIGTVSRGVDQIVINDAGFFFKC